MEELDSSALQKLEEERLRLEEQILEERKRLEERRQPKLDEKLKKVSLEEIEKQMTVEEVAQYLGLDEQSIGRFVATGQIPFIETPEGIRFEKGALMFSATSLIAKMRLWACRPLGRWAWGAVARFGVIDL